ncbi:MAG: TlpA family protein disulfide reductase, partial [Acidimicrobiia bacterium]
MKRMCAVAVVASLVLVACGGQSQDITNIADLEPISPQEFEAHLQDLGRPAVVNVWASWCIPCRSEAPLLDAAFDTHGEDVSFIGVDVQDNQVDAKAFLAEFGLDFTHYFDPQR